MTTAFATTVSHVADALAAAVGERAIVAIDGFLAEDDAVPRATVHVLLQGATPRQLLSGRDRVERPVDLQIVVVVDAGIAGADLLHDCWRALERLPDVLLVNDPIDPSWWLAMGRAPRPAIRIAATAIISDLHEVGPIVQEPLHVRHTPHP